MKFFKSKIFIICLIAAILLTLVPTLIAAFGGTDLLRSAVGTVAKPFAFCASSVANAFNGFLNVFSEYDELAAENERLREELESYRDKEYSEDVLKKQNEWLAEYLNLHNEHPELALKDARVIAREAGNYSTCLTLNRGSLHGVKKGMPVVTGDGLLGYISEIGADWSRVSTIIEPKNSTGVYTDRAGAIGVLEGEADLQYDGLCKMLFIQGQKNVQAGDRIYTSGGEGSMYPSGLFVGSVKALDIDRNTGEMVATVEPAVDFTDISSVVGVMIVCGYEGGNS